MIDRVKYLGDLNVDKEVLIYLKDLLANLNINILGETKGNIFDLMENRYLEGWCFETTESAIVFFNDDDYIERGNLILNDYNKNDYYHSWICFKYNDKYYVFDPCLKIICDKKIYHDILEAKVLAKTRAISVKKELIKQVLNYKPKEAKYDIFKSLFEDKYDDYLKEHEGEIVCKSSNDPFMPLYRNNSGYKLTLDNNEIKNISVHYYY